jgi:hypothetical protein
MEHIAGLLDLLLVMHLVVVLISRLLLEAGT